MSHQVLFFFVFTHDKKVQVATAIITFYPIVKFKKQLQLIRHIILNLTLVGFKK